MDSPTQRRKSAVLLTERPYLEENIGDPCRYIPVFKGKGILSPAQCCDIKEQRSVEYQMGKFLEFISMDGRSFTVFCRVLREQGVHGHVATHLKKKASEMDRLSSQGEMLSTEQQRVLILVEFSHRTQMNHDFARDILSNVDWDLSRALEAAERMNCPQDIPDTASQDTNSAECSSGVQRQQCQEVKVHPEYGLLPPQPPPLPSEDAQNLTTDLEEDEFGPRPVPPQYPLSTEPATEIAFSKRTKMAANKSLSLREKNSPPFYELPVARSNTTPERSNPRLRCENGSARQKTPIENIPPNLHLSRERGRERGLPTRNPLKKTPSPPGEIGRADPKTPIGNISPCLRHSHESGTPEHAPKRKLGTPVGQSVPPPYVDPPQLSPPEDQQAKELKSHCHHSPPRHSKSQPAVGSPHTVNLSPKGKSASNLPSTSPGTQTSSDATPYIMDISDDKAKELMRMVGKPGVFFIRPSAAKDSPHTLCLTSGRNYLKYHIKSNPFGFHIDNESFFDSVSELVEHYKKHPVKHSRSSDDKNSSDTELTTPMSDYPGDAMETRPKIFHLGSERQLYQPQHLTQQPGGASKQGVQTPNTLSTRMLTSDSDVTRHHPVAVSTAEDRSPDHSTEGNCSQRKSTPISPHFPTRSTPNRLKKPSNHPSMLELQMMEDAEGYEIRIIDEIAPKWDQVAIALEVDPLYINILARDYPQNSQQACYKMLLHWKESQASQVSWGFLVDALRRADYKVLAEKIEKVQEIKIKSV